MRMEEIETKVETKTVNDVKPVQVKSVDLKEPNVWEITGLPSRGKIYPPNTKLFGRPLKLVEVKKLSSIQENTANFIVNDIIKHTIAGIDVNDLLISDKLFLIFWLRANTYRENGFTIDFECVHCNEKGKFNFTLDNLDVTYLPDDWSPDMMTFKTLHGDEITFHLLTVAEEQLANKFKAGFGNILKDIDEDILSVALMITTINGKKLDLLDKYNYLISDELSAQGYVYIISKLRKIDCGVSSTLKVPCSKCGGISHTAVSFREEFFLPEYKFE
jgi:hypothetical protein